MGKKKIIVNQMKKVKGQIFIVFLLTIIAAIAELAVPFLTQKIIDTGILRKNFKFVVLMSLSMVVLFIILSLINSIINVLFSKISIKIVTNFKKDIISNLIRYPASFFDNNKTGYVISRVDEIDNLNSLFTPIIMSFLKSIISFIGAFFVIITIKWELLLLTTLFLPILYFITRLTSKQIYNSSKELSEISAEAQGEIYEDIAGLAEMKNSNLESHKENEIKNYFNSIAKKLIKRNIFVVIGSESVSLFITVSRSIFIIMISYFIIKGELTVGTYFSLLSYLSSLFIPVQMFSSINLSIQPALAVLSRMDFFSENEAESKGFGTIVIDKIDSIQFKNVSFSYPDNERKVINDINLKLNNEKNLFIYGPNGSGKTTIVKLLLGFYTNYSGEILINGYNLYEISINDLRSKIGVVSQKINLFSGSVMDNIRQWDDTLTDEDVIRILDEFELSNILINEKYHHINELGKNLSGGQLQEIALSRAVLRQPSLYIFDEPTANLDVQNKEKFVQLLDKLNKKLCIIITHDEFLISKMNSEEDLVLDISLDISNVRENGA